MKTAEQEVARNETGSSWSGTFHLPHEERRKNTRSSFGVICVYLCYDFFSTRLRYSRDTQRFAACFILRAFSKLQVSIAPWGKHTTRGCRRHRMSFPDRHVTNQRIQTNYILLHPRPGASLLLCAKLLVWLVTWSTRGNEASTRRTDVSAELIKFMEGGMIIVLADNTECDCRRRGPPRLHAVAH